MKKRALNGLILLLLSVASCIGVDVLQDPETATNLSRVDIVNPGSTQLFTGDTLQLSFTYFNPEGTEMIPSNISWESSDPAIALVDGSGQVTALSVGNVRIVVTANRSATDSLDLTITNNPDSVNTFTIQAPAGQAALVQGESLQLSFVAINADGDTIQGQNPVWVSEDTTILTVSNTGLVQAVSTGQTSVKAILGDIESDPIFISVVVDNSTLASIQITPLFSNIQLGESQQFTAKGFNMDGDSLSGLNFIWESSDPSLATIDAHGLAQGLGGGTVSIRARVDDFFSSPASLQVIDPNQVTSLQITAPDNTLTVGETTQFSFMAFNANGTALDNAGLNPQWFSSSSAVLSIDANGLASAQNNGTAQIRADLDGVLSNIVFVAVQDSTVSESRTGTFQGLNGYTVRGDVTVRNPSNQNNLVIETAANFFSQSGPGLYIYLSNNANNANGGIEVAPLQANSGVSTYQVPEGVGIDDYNFVLVFCKPFGLPFGAASLN